MTIMGITEYAAAFIFGTLTIARITRLISWDDFPPMVWLRMKWDKLTGVDPDIPHNARSGWNKLIYCGYCVGMYVGIGIAAWAFIWDFPTAWWIFCSTVSASYVSAMVLSRDWG